MKLEKIMQKLFFATDDVYVKFTSENGPNSCDACKKHDGEIYLYDDPSKPKIPIHPNCKCKYEAVNKEKFEKQENFSFGTMTPQDWSDLPNDDKNLWANSFRKKFGTDINKYSKKHNVPKELVAGVIANEMLDWHWPDGTFMDGIGGGGIGYAQIANSTLKKQGINNVNVKSVNGSVEATCKILKKYFNELKDREKNNTLGKGFKDSLLYSIRYHDILSEDIIYDKKIPAWILCSMCAVWNSGVGVLDAKNSLGGKNYENAHSHGLNSLLLFHYLSKLVE